MASNKVRDAMAEKAGWNTTPLPQAKKCPFCGGHPEGQYTNVFWIACTDCEAESGASCDPFEALERWNKRTGLSMPSGPKPVY